MNKESVYWSIGSVIVILILGFAIAENTSIFDFKKQEKNEGISFVKNNGTENQNGENSVERSSEEIIRRNREYSSVGNLINKKLLLEDLFSFYSANQVLYQAEYENKNNSVYAFVENNNTKSICDVVFYFSFYDENDSLIKNIETEKKIVNSKELVEFNLVVENNFFKYWSVQIGSRFCN